MRDLGVRVDGDQQSWTAIPAKNGSTPPASIACRPRLAWTVISANLPDDAEWTQASFPATRNPVSAKAARPAVTSALRIASSGAPSVPAIRLTIPATAPGDTGTPNSSLTASHVRPRDRNCPCHRYAHAAVTRGPYCTGAVTPAGAAPGVTVPQQQRRALTSCPVPPPPTAPRRAL